jgi:RimJ/RimL family protein N-acetyltransferase
LNYRFYGAATGAIPVGVDEPLDPACVYRMWRPRGHSVVPPGVRDRACLRAFVHTWATSLLAGRNDPYCFLLIYRAGVLVHYTGVVRTCFRFPFMAPDDLQLGPVWTHPDHRRRGLLTFSLQTLLTSLRRPGRTFWWLCRAENAASVRAVEKLGFALMGSGDRTGRFGLRPLGVFRLRAGIEQDRTMQTSV